jgi:hypothetical protein
MMRLKGRPEFEVLYTTHSAVCDLAKVGSANIATAIILASVKAHEPE